MFVGQYAVAGGLCGEGLHEPQALDIVVDKRTESTKMAAASLLLEAIAYVSYVLCCVACSCEGCPYLEENSEVDVGSLIEWKRVKNCDNVLAWIFCLLLIRALSAALFSLLLRNFYK